MVALPRGRNCSLLKESLATSAGTLGKRLPEYRENMIYCHLLQVSNLSVSLFFNTLFNTVFLNLCAGAHLRVCRREPGSCRSRQAYVLRKLAVACRARPQLDIPHMPNGGGRSGKSHRAIPWQPRLPLVAWRPGRQKRRRDREAVAFYITTFCICSCSSLLAFLCGRSQQGAVATYRESNVASLCPPLFPPTSFPTEGVGSDAPG